MVCMHAHAFECVCVNFFHTVWLHAQVASWPYNIYTVIPHVNTKIIGIIIWFVLVVCCYKVSEMPHDL